jgi:hypothetical protein
MFEKLGRSVVKHRKGAVVLFIVGILVAGGIGSMVFSRLDSAGYSDPKSDSYKVYQYLTDELKLSDPVVVLVVDAGTKDVTDPEVTQKALAPKSTSVPAAEPAATKPVDTPAVTSEPKKGFYKNIGLTPAQKNAMALTRAAKGIQTGSTGTSPAGSVSKPAAAPAASTPTSTAAAPAATSTLPTKAKSNTKAKDIDIDAALKMADTLSPVEKKKLLQDLLKSGVTVKAGGA